MAGILLVFAHTQAHGEITRTESASIRESKRFEIYFGAVSERYPSYFSLNVAYNVLDHLRLSAGAGTIVFGSSYGIGGNFVLDVNWMWLASSTESIGTKVCPYVNVGWLFQAAT